MSLILFGFENIFRKSKSARKIKIVSRLKRKYCLSVVDKLGKSWNEKCLDETIDDKADKINMKMSIIMLKRKEKRSKYYFLSH